MNDIRIYKERMAKSMTRAEKLFFLDHLDLYTYDTIIDFGGANGLLLHELQRKFPLLSVECRFIIVDNNPKMMSDYYVMNCTRVASLDEIGELHGRVLLICSSVLHECGLHDIDMLYLFCNEHVSTLVVRDMAYTNLTFWMHDLTEDDFAYSFAGRKAYERICANEDYRKRFLEMLPYCNEWKQDTLQALTHFILKCDYRENWETEIRENYFSNNATKLSQWLVNMDAWRTLYYRNYALPYKKAQAKEDFDFDIPNTHIQIILERPEKENE